MLQKLRERVGARLSGNSESGFTLVELLVVMLILGVLAAIAIPAFFNQRTKANDAQAKAFAHSAQVALETYSTDHGGLYTGADVTQLKTIEPTLSGATTNGYTLTLTIAPTAYTIAIGSTTGNVFSIVRAAGGGLTYPCTTAGQGGCPAGANGWGQ